MILPIVTLCLCWSESTHAYQLFLSEEAQLEEEEEEEEIEVKCDDEEEEEEEEEEEGAPKYYEPSIMYK